MVIYTYTQISPFLKKKNQTYKYVYQRICSLQFALFFISLITYHSSGKMFATCIKTLPFLTFEVAGQMI